MRASEISLMLTASRPLPGDLHEGPKSANRTIFAEIGLADFSGAGDVADHLHGRVARAALTAKTFTLPSSITSIFTARSVNNRANLFAARSDQVANLIGRGSSACRAAARMAKSLCAIPVSVLSITSRMCIRACRACSRPCASARC